MKLYIIRHGQTEWNKQKKLQGRSDILLNAYGIQLAKETKVGLENVKFDLAFTSPLKRAKKTAEILLAGRDVQLLEDRRIIEIGFGSYEGLCYAKDNYNIPDPDFMNFFEKPEAYHPAPDGESFEQLRARAADFLQELSEKKEYRESTILVSTHGAALCALLNVIKNSTIEKFWEGGLHKNCGLSIVEIKDGKAKILKEAIVLYEDAK